MKLDLQLERVQQKRIKAYIQPSMIRLNFNGALACLAGTGPGLNTNACTVGAHVGRCNAGGDASRSDRACIAGNNALATEQACSKGSSAIGRTDSCGGGLGPVTNSKWQCHAGTGVA